MRVIVLGTAAGGGFPQWNCGCAQCQASRTGNPHVPSRLQSGLAVSADNGKWFLVNASPDVGRQVELFLRPLGDLTNPRDSPISGVLLTNADLDHCLGLLTLREGPPLTIHAPDATRDALTDGLNLDVILASFCGMEWKRPTGGWQTLAPGLETRLVPLRGADAPRYATPPRDPVATQAVGYLFRSRPNSPIVGVFPDVAILDDELIAELRKCTQVFFDGTFWTPDEMTRLGYSTRDAAAMGHVPVSGSGGSLPVLASLPARCAYVHINNTNPLLHADSPERANIEAAGLRVADDGEIHEL